METNSKELYKNINGNQGIGILDSDFNPKSESLETKKN